MNVEPPLVKHTIYQKYAKNFGLEAVETSLKKEKIREKYRKGVT